MDSSNITHTRKFAGRFAILSSVQDAVSTSPTLVPITALDALPHKFVNKLLHSSFLLVIGSCKKLELFLALNELF